MASRRQRVLFVVVPSFGHVFPMMPIAWALRTAGCDVLVATCDSAPHNHPRAHYDSAAAIRAAGFPTADMINGANLTPIYMNLKEGAYDVAESLDGVNRLGGIVPVVMKLGDMMADGVVELARRWRADVIVHDAYSAAGPIAAAALDLPAVFLTIALAETPELFREHVYSRMTETLARLSVASVPPPAAWVDVVPPSLRDAETAALPRLLMKYVPYCGSCAVDDEMLTPRERPLTVITLGTTASRVGGYRPLRSIIRAAGDVAAEFVVTFGWGPTDVQDKPYPYGWLPPNVQSIAWRPFDRLLAHCEAVIHHGGPGTALASLAAGLPQLICPQGADCRYNAVTLSRRGAAMVCDDFGAVDAETMTRFLATDSYRAAAAEVRDEIMAMPTPNEVTATLTALAN